MAEYCAGPQGEEASKKNKIKEILRKIFLCISIICFIYSSGYLFNNLVLIPLANDSSYSDARNLYGRDAVKQSDSGIWTNDAKDSAEQRNAKGILMEFDQLVDLYPDLVGWIEVPGTKINYPVLQSPLKENNNYYIHKGINGKYNKNGSIFADVRNDFSDGTAVNRNIILYGHNMKSGEMFADLMKYDDAEFYKKSPVIRMDTIYEKGLWVVIAVMKCNTLQAHGEPFYYARTEFEDQDAFETFISEVKARSMINTPYTADKEDQIITLQTCSYEYTGFRTVVIARKLHDDEKEIDASSCAKASNPMMPSVWKK